ncbi:hypothetical protein AAVH_26882 [Aphelenchoides avenae]|nr:hypothetical protein AAVH_26882 [Aphelenchus avenae]
MLEHRRSFFEDPAFIPKLLDEKQMDLLDYYLRIQRYIEDIISDRDATRSGDQLTDLVSSHARCRLRHGNPPPSASARSSLKPIPTNDAGTHPTPAAQGTFSERSCRHRSRWAGQLHVEEHAKTHSAQQPTSLLVTHLPRVL